MIGSGDLQRLITELTLRGENAEEWLEENDVSDEAAEYLAAGISHAFRTALLDLASAKLTGKPYDRESDEPLQIGPEDNVIDIAISAAAMMAFTIGWEAHRQYGTPAS